MPHPSTRNTYRRSTLAAQVLQLQSQLKAVGAETRKGMRQRLTMQEKRIKELEAQLQVVADALGTGETGANLVAVARDAHTAEMKLAAIEREQENRDDSNATDVH